MSDELDEYLKAFGVKPQVDGLRDKQGKIIECWYCAHHPVSVRHVPAVTLTREGTPRCAPCGRWVE